MLSASADLHAPPPSRTGSYFTPHLCTLVSDVGLVVRTFDYTAKEVAGSTPVGAPNVDSEDGRRQFSRQYPASAPSNRQERIDRSILKRSKTEFPIDPAPSRQQAAARHMTDRKWRLYSSLSLRQANVR